MMQDFSTLTLGALLSHRSELVRRNATSILKYLQRQQSAPPVERPKVGQCDDCGHFGTDCTCIN